LWHLALGAKIAKSHWHVRSWSLCRCRNLTKGCRQLWWGAYAPLNLRVVCHELLQFKTMAPSPQVQNGDPHRTTLTIANLNRPADKKKIKMCHS
jgi:hypothetical protein